MICLTWRKTGQLCLDSLGLRKKKHDLTILHQILRGRIDSTEILAGFSLAVPCAKLLSFCCFFFFLFLLASFSLPFSSSLLVYLLHFWLSLFPFLLFIRPSSFLLLSFWLLLLGFLLPQLRFTSFLFFSFLSAFFFFVSDS